MIKILKIIEVLFIQLYNEWNWKLNFQSLDWIIVGCKFTLSR